MLIDWLISVVFVGILLSWNPAVWASGILQFGVSILSTIMLLRQVINRAPLRLAPDTIVLAAVVLWGPLQLLLHQTVYPFETWNATISWLITVSVYLMARTLLKNRVARQHFLTITLWIGATIAIVSTLFLFSAPTKVFGIFESRYPPFGPFVYKNHFAVFIELLIPVAFYKMVSSGRQGAAYGVMLAALLASVVASVSRGGLVVAFGELLVLAGASWAQRKVGGITLLKVGIPLIALVIAFSAVVGWGAMMRRFREPHPFQHRTELVESSLEMIEARPITGFGLGTWRTAYPQFGKFDIARLANEAHNDWVEWAAEGGLPFFALMLFFAAWVSRFAWRHTWGIGVPAVFVHCLIDFPTRIPALAALMFLFAGALASTRLEKQKGAREDDPEWQVLSVRTAAE